MFIRFVLIFSISIIGISSSLAHSGGKNGDGCHTNRKTGDFHCHSGGVSTRGEAGEFCHVIRGEDHCGYSPSGCEDLRGQFGGDCVPE